MNQKTTVGTHRRQLGERRPKVLSLLMLLLLALPAVVQAQFTYTIFNNTVTITAYYGSGGAVVIPATINGLRVTRIGDFAFYDNTDLTSVTIPNSVTSIGDGAFARCTSLSAITVDALNFFYSSVDGVLFNKSQTVLIQCPAGKAGGYIVPNSVTWIGFFAFESCTSLTNVTIGNSVTSIGQSAFESCTSLTNVTIPNSVTIIGYRAFLSCTSLAGVTIPNSVPSLGDAAFYSCTSLTNVTIGNGVTNVGGYAFALCTSLTSVTIPNSVTIIGQSAFGGCTSLTSVTIPNSVTGIGYDAFSGCTSLNVITVDALNSVYSSVDGILFNKSQTLLIRCPGGKAGSYTVPNSVTYIGDEAFSFCTSLTSVTIPNSVTSIGGYAFAYCTSLTSVTIGNGVTGIGSGAFYYCTSLTSVTIGNSVTYIGDEAFYYCTSLTGVYFQGNAPSVGADVFTGADNTTAYYLPGTRGWGITFADRPAVLWNPLMQTSGVGPAGFGFNITGTTNIPIVVEATTNLANGPWVPLQSLNLTNGAFYFSDSNWTNCPVCFYRIRSP